MTEEIRSSLDNRRYGCGIFVDLQEAFDTVNHGILLNKLEHYGIRGHVLDWFKSYLSERRQFVSINGSSSSVMRTTCGVPQGSVLGPLLFLIYGNVLTNVSKKLQFYLFADDTNIYCDGDTLTNLAKIVNKELKSVKKWLDVNRLSLKAGFYLNFYKKINVWFFSYYETSTIVVHCRMCFGFIFRVFS